MSSYPLRDTVLKTYCKGKDKWATYADGRGGTYEGILRASAPDCMRDIEQIEEYCWGDDLYQVRRRSDGTEVHTLLEENCPRCLSQSQQASASSTSASASASASADDEDADDENDELLSSLPPNIHDLIQTIVAPVNRRADIHEKNALNEAKKVASQKLFGLSDYPSKRDINVAYQKMALKWHTDKLVGKSQAVKDFGKRLMEAVNDAKTILSESAGGRRRTKRNRRSTKHKRRGNRKSKRYH
jgi:hypothetical protein